MRYIHWRKQPREIHYIKDGYREKITLKPNTPIHTNLTLIQKKITKENSIFFIIFFFFSLSALAH
jgi:hypothetical protein